MAFVLAHLSDPHLGPLPRASLRELIGKRATGFINWRRRRAAIHQPEVLAKIVADIKRNAPDHVVVTGDLVNLALPGEYAPARAWLNALGSPSDVTLVPGNHDAYVRGGLADSLAHWGDFMRGDDGAAFPFLRRRGPLALIGVSTAAPSPPFMATGRVGPEQLQRLATVLQDARREGLYRVVAIHHPPTSNRSHHLKRLTDGAHLRKVLKHEGAELLIHGHNHRRQIVMLAGPGKSIPAIGVPSASEMPSGRHDAAGYNLLRIEGSPGAWRCEVVARGIAGDAIVETERTVMT